MPIDALIIGAGGQDGFYLMLELLDRGKRVVAVYRNQESYLVGLNDLEHLGSDQLKNLTRIYGSFESKVVCTELLAKYRPSVVFHLAGVNLPSNSTQFENSKIAEAMFRTHCLITENVLQCLKESRNSRLIVALSSRMFRKPTTEDLLLSSSSIPTPFDYYGFTKSAAWNSVKFYREKYSVEAYGVILFNHDSPRRKSGFLIPHLVNEFRRALNGEIFYFEINNWASRQDWSDSRDVANALSQLVENPTKSDLAIGTGQGMSVNQIVLDTIQLLNLDQARFCSKFSIPTFVPFEPTLIADLSELSALFPWTPQRTVPNLIVEQLQ